MLFRIFVSCLLLLIINHQLIAQNTDTTIINQQSEQELERIIENSEDADNVDNTSVLEEMKSLQSSKININKVSYEQLIATGLFDDLRAQSLINYRNQFGEFKSINELQSIYGMDRDGYLNILPFVSIDDNNLYKQTSWKDLITRGKHQIFLRYRQPIESARGYNADTLGNTKYLGNNMSLFLRYRYLQGNNLSYGLTIEKDAGEKVWNNSFRSKFDYLSGHILLSNRKWLKTLALGDYEMNLGQGLVCWQGYGIAKGGDPTRTKRNGKTIQAHSSANEFNFFRGAAATLNFGDWYITSMVSYRKRDANVLVDTLVEIDDDISSLQTSGLHRTSSEIADRNAIKVFNTGGSIKWRGERLNIAGNILYTKLERSLESSNDAYNYYDFRGKNLINGSIDYSYLFNKWHLFGEAAMNNNNAGFALVNGAMIKPVPGVSFSVIHRYYSPKYFGLYADAFSESTTPVNEHGFYFGTTFSPLKKVMVESYFDYFLFPWLRFGVDQPKTSGLEAYSQVTWTPTRTTRLYMRIRYEAKQANAPDADAPVDYTTTNKTLKARLNIDFDPTKNWTFRTRFEFSKFDNSFDTKEKGYLIFQDIGWQTNKGHFSIIGRYCLFDTPSYDTRIYTYENDVLYAFSVPAFYGKGNRYYVMTKFRITRYLDLWLKFSQTYYPNQETIGSSYDEISDNRRSEVKMQLRVKF